MKPALAVWAFAAVLAAGGAAFADGEPRLWEPDEAVGYLLGGAVQANPGGRG